MIVIISDSKKENIGQLLYEYYKNANQEVEFISASDRDIKPCYACEGCSNKTKGKCVVRDDMDQILPVMIKGEIVIYTSPLLWGGFSYDIKKVLDKSALIGNRFYKIRNKELVKGTVSKNKKIVGIGVNDQASENERNSFISYIKELGIILDIEYITT